MPHEINELGTPEDWLKRAKSNLAIARQPKTEEIFWEDFCFEIQQAAEKALKAVLLSKGIKFRFVHDLAELLTLLEQNGILLPEEIRPSADLTGYSVSDPITDRASSVIVAHNHQSGGLTPSKDDIEITKQLKAAGEILGITLLDHIIFNHKGYYSFLERGEL